MEALIGVVIGGGIGLVSSWFLRWWEQQQAQARARAMALAYVNGVLKMQEELQHVELYRRWLREKSPRNGLPRILGAGERPKDEVRTAIIGQLGLLSPSDAGDMVLFFNRLESIDIGTREMFSTPDANLTVVVERHVAMMDEMLELGRKLVRRLGAG
jgi:hypothetical protein